MTTDQIDVFTQSSIRIRGSELTVYCDPFKMTEDPHDADLIFITHDHFDHFSVEDIGKVSKESTVLVIPEKMKEKAAEAAPLVSRIETVAPGNSYEKEGLSFETVPSYNKLKPFHPKGAGWVGYIFTIEGQRIYVAGDTDPNKDNKTVRCDIALVPIGGTYTMDALKAADFINEIRPAVAIPTHYGSIVGRPEDASVFAGSVDKAIQVVTKLTF